MKLGNRQGAWHEYKEAESLTQMRKDSRLDEIRALLAKVEQSSVRLEVMTPAVAPADLAISVDGRPISKETPEPILVEPDTEHVVMANAEGKLPWRTTVRGQAGNVMRVEITLQDAKREPVSSVAPSAPRLEEERALGPPSPKMDAGRGTRTLGLAIGGAGLAAIAAGGVFGVLALNSRNSLEDSIESNCHGKPCSEGARDTLDPIESRANTQATVFTVLFGVGGAALVTGAVLWFVAPKNARTPTTGSHGWLVGGSPDPRMPIGFSVRGPL